MMTFDKGFTKKDKAIIYQYDYLNDIRKRLSAKSNILNASSIALNADIPRSVVTKFINNEIPNTSFENIVKLYKFIEEQNI